MTHNAATKLQDGAAIPVEVRTPGSITVFCEKLHGILRSLPDGEVELERADDTVLRINDGCIPAKW